MKEVIPRAVDLSVAPRSSSDRGGAASASAEVHVALSTGTAARGPMRRLRRRETARRRRRRRRRERRNPHRLCIGPHTWTPSDGQGVAKGPGGARAAPSDQALLPRISDPTEVMRPRSLPVRSWCCHCICAFASRIATTRCKEQRNCGEVRT